MQTFFSAPTWPDGLIAPESYKSNRMSLAFVLTTNVQAFRPPMNCKYEEAQTIAQGENSSFA